MKQRSCTKNYEESPRIVHTHACLTQHVLFGYVWTFGNFLNLRVSVTCVYGQRTHRQFRRQSAQLRPPHVYYTSVSTVQWTTLDSLSSYTLPAGSLYFVHISPKFPGGLVTVKSSIMCEPRVNLKTHSLSFLPFSDPSDSIILFHPFSLLLLVLLLYPVTGIAFSLVTVSRLLHFTDQ